MEDYYSKRHSPKKDWKANGLCVAYYPAKDEYYRAIILEVYEDKVKVLLRDVAEEASFTIYLTICTYVEKFFFGTLILVGAVSRISFKQIILDLPASY